MKIKIIAATLLTASLIVVLVKAQKDASAADLELKVWSSESSFLLGQTIPITFELKNLSSTARFAKTFDPRIGYLKLYISRNKEPYQKYVGPGWGRLDTSAGNIELNKNESLKLSVLVLWNGTPDFSLKTPNEVKNKTVESEIHTSYAFPDEGNYEIKAVYTIHFTGEKEPSFITSKPFSVHVTAPTGTDLEVWNKIKDNGKFAYFLQEGEIQIPSYRTEERAKFLSEIEQIISDYPDSFYARSLQQSLQKFRASEAKQQEMMEKLQKQKPQ